MRLVVFIIFLITNTILVHAADLKTIYEWKFIDYVWEPKDPRQQMYNYTQVAPMDVDQAPDGRVFVTLLGKAFLPAALGTVTDLMGPGGPLIKPYPNWSYYKKDDCYSIWTVIRIAIDECGRLWVLDAGDLENQTCGAQLIVFDLKTDHLIQRIRIPNKYAVGKNGNTILSTPIVEIGESCKDITVYIADTFGYGMVIWNNGKLSRLENPLFQPSEDGTLITSGNLTIEWQDGLVGLAIPPKLYSNEPRFLYFRALASFDLHAVTTDNLKSSIDGSDIDAFVTKNALRRQAFAMAFSAENALFMGQTGDSSIVCWNRQRVMEKYNFITVAQDDVRLQYVNGVKILPIANSKDEELLVLSNRFVAFSMDKLDFNEYNYHVLKGSVKKLIAGTACEPPKIN